MQNVPTSSAFVGRSGELAALAEAFRLSDCGEPQRIVISGEAGVGKTRLVEEFAVMARENGALVASGECIETGAEGLPYAPFPAVLWSLVRQSTKSCVTGADDLPDELAGILPEWGNSAPLNLEPAGGAARLFALAVQLLERLAVERTVVIILEDLHWADASTRAMLTHIFRTLRGSRVLVIATYRADDLHPRHPLRPFLAQFDRLRTVIRISLPRFTRGEVARQITGILSAEPKPTAVDRIFERSDGNAFFVEELVRALSSGSQAYLSESLRGLLLARLQSLPEEAQQIARVVAEGGSDVEYPLLRTVTKVSEDDLIEALRNAVDAQILLPTPDGEGYRFRHSLVREAVSDELLPGERSRLNRRFAEALEADPSLARPGERTARLAAYWYAAHNHEKALVMSLRAAVEARCRYAYAEQSRLLERAMELWDVVPPTVLTTLRPPDRTETFRSGDGDGSAPAVLDHLDLLAEAAIAARLGGNRERALVIAKQGTSNADAQGDELRTAWFWIQRSYLVQELELNDGRWELDHAYELVRRQPPSAFHAEVLVALAGWGARHEPGPDSLASAERAVAYAHQVGAEYTELHARLIRGWLTADAGGFEGSLADLYRVRARAEELSAVGVLGRVSIILPSALEGMGKSAEAVAAAKEGIKACAALGLSDEEAWVRCNLSLSLFSLGYWDRSEQVLEEAINLARSHKAYGLVSSRRSQMALMRGDLETAKHQLVLAREYFGTYDPQPQLLIGLADVAIRVAAAEGLFEQARAEFIKIEAVGFPPGTERYALPLLCTMAAVEADAMDAARPDNEHEAVIHRIGEHAAQLRLLVPVQRAYYLMLQAELRRASGAPDPRLWASTAAAFAELERPYELALAHARWAASLLPTRNQRPKATDLLRAAYAGATTLGARLLMDELSLLAARARVNLAPSAGQSATVDRSAVSAVDGQGSSEKDHLLGLTPRELDVLRLLTRGDSNRRIGKELFISPKTVSVHVSHILTKLGVTGRGEAVALAHRSGLPSPD
ncbi:helix-turn-helix transcriptional regulator [Streptomyces sp. NBC_01497]|uniref:helix-turn-helix transcriptional regulator n=1 Tax=Streptomyces sp. NBC_01497 TaxID=2903885 RepID=UPI002E33D0A1|nr:AAA family ATPase [Streptomyces sp. NBC_01497]